MIKKPIALLLIVLSFSACAQKEEDSGKVLAKVNEFTLLQSEYKALLAQEAEYEPDFKLTRENRERFLNELIHKELLIQEAKRLKLDRREKFVRAIERYWEATLIRDLMEEKGREIGATTFITQKEIDTCDPKLYPVEKENTSPEELKVRITARLKEDKKCQRLKKWIEGLKEKADIQINKDLL